MSQVSEAAQKQHTPYFGKPFPRSGGISELFALLSNLLKGENKATAEKPLAPVSQDRHM